RRYQPDERAVRRNDRSAANASGAQMRNRAVDRLLLTDYERVAGHDLTGRQSRHIGRPLVLSADHIPVGDHPDDSRTRGIAFDHDDGADMLVPHETRHIGDRRTGGDADRTEIAEASD